MGAINLSELVVKVPVVRDGSMIYSLDRRGPAPWKELRVMDYGKNPETGIPFKQLTFPQTARLAHWGVSNYKLEQAEPIVKAIDSYGVTGNTLALWTSDEIYGVDFPEDSLVAQLGVNNREALVRIARNLRNRLGKKEESGVVFSEDGRIRQTKREGIISEILSSKSALATHRGNIVLSGSLENADLVSQIAERYAGNPKFFAFENNYGVKVVSLYSSGALDSYRLDVGGLSWSDGDSGFAFGGLGSGEASTQKNSA